jgi:hypothetical protein
MLPVWQALDLRLKQALADRKSEQCSPARKLVLLIGESNRPGLVSLAMTGRSAQPQRIKPPDPFRLSGLWSEAVGIFESSPGTPVNGRPFGVVYGN